MKTAKTKKSNVKQKAYAEKQAQKAKIYFREREALKKREVNLFLVENKRCLEELDKVKDHEETASADLEKARGQYEKIGEEYEAGQLKIRELETEIETVRSRITNASVIREKLEGDIKVFEEQVRAASGNAEHFKARREAVSADIERSLREQEEIIERKKGIDSKVEELRYEQMKARESASSCADKITSYARQADLGKNEILRILSERATIKSGIASIKTRQEENERRKLELSEGIEQAHTSETINAQMIEDAKAVLAQASDAAAEAGA